MIKLSHARASFYLAAAAGVLAWGWALYAVPYLAVVVGVDVFFIAYLVRTLAAVPSFDAQQMRQNAGHRDEPLWLVLIITLAAAALAVILVISVGSKSERDAIVLVMTLASLPLAWATIHAMMAWHYAHMYWRKADKEDTDGSQTQDGYHGGLIFPGGKPPGARDFLYFSFVIRGCRADCGCLHLVLTHPGGEFAAFARGLHLQHRASGCGSQCRGNAGLAGGPVRAF